MELSDFILIVALFFVAYKVSEPPRESKKQQGMQTKPEKYERYIHRYREQPPDRKDILEMQEELARRGVNPNMLPALGKDLKPEEVAAKLRILVDEVPYKPNDITTPGEDSSLAKSTLAVWNRPVDMDDS